MSDESDEDVLAGETVELGLAVCLPAIVLLVFVGSVEQELFHLIKDILSNFRYLVTVLWRCYLTEKSQVQQEPFSSNLPNKTRKYKMLSNSHTQTTSLPHLQAANSVFCSPETTTGSPLSPDLVSLQDVDKM